LDELKRLKNINDDFEYSTQTAIKDDSEYLNEWKKFFAPIELKKLVIVPPWLDDFKTDKPIVYVNPSMAFGTGAHPTTKMCLDAMQELDLKDKTVIDLGCGSGILGISALKLGAKKAIMLDNDQSATKIAQENLKHNNMTPKAQIILGTLGKVSIIADVIFANITADVLISLKDLLFDRLISGGILVLSGIIDQRLSDLEKAFDGFELINQISMDNWRCLIYKKG
jgi:ribosomal protein L11 methyltransferase